MIVRQVVKILNMNDTRIMRLNETFRLEI